MQQKAITLNLIAILLIQFFGEFASADEDGVFALVMIFISNIRRITQMSPIIGQLIYCKHLILRSLCGKHESVVGMVVKSDAFLC